MRFQETPAPTRWGPSEHTVWPCLAPSWGNTRVPVSPWALQVRLGPVLPGCPLAPGCLRALVHGRELPLCARVSVPAHACLMSVAGTARAWPAFPGLSEPLMRLQLCSFGSSFPLFSPRSLIDMLLPCSLPAGHTQRGRCAPSQVWAQKNPPQPLRAQLLRRPLGGQPAWLARACPRPARRHWAPCAHRRLGMRTQVRQGQLGTRALPRQPG